VTLFVVIVYRHATLAYDGVESTAANRVIIKDFLFAVSDEKSHNALVRT
jgi:hypothetical protein